MKQLKLLLILSALILSPYLVHSQCNDAPIYNDPASQDGLLEIMNIPCAWTITNGDPDIIVAVCDKYLDDAHDDLAGKVILPINGFCNPADADYHHGIQSFGAVTGIRNNGICITGSGGDTRVAGWCGATNDTKLTEILNQGYKIVSVSYWSSMSRSKMLELTENGVVVLVAGLDQHHQAYQDVPGVIHVGRAYLDGSYWQYNSANSNPNQNLDVLVVTEGINRIADANSCEPSGQGTSIGTPLLAGVVALMRSVNPCLSPSDIEEILVATAGEIPSNAGLNTMRAGVIDAYAAVLAALNFSGEDQTWGAGGGGETIQNAQVSGNLDIFSGGDVTVEGNVYFGSESVVTIQSSAKLTVTGSLNLGENARIIVKRGGQLVVDGGKLTKSFCADSWRGIIVEGNVDFVQQLPKSPTDPEKCGIVHLKNNAVVEYAKHAISMSPRHLTWPTSQYYYGGLVIAEDAIFRNNTRSVEFMKYINFVDQSRFENVSFEGDGGFIATHWENHGVTYDNCSFSDYDKQALLTYNAAINVFNGCYFDNAGHTQYDQASIHLYQTTSIPFASKIGNENGEPNVFSGGYYGVYSTAAGNPVRTEIINNIFIGGNAGVTMDGISNQTIENNDFIGQVTGNRIIDNGSDVNLAKLNYYSDCKVGIFVWFDNSNYEFVANCFESSDRRDFRLDEGEILGDQGSVAFSASNCFSDGFANGIHLSGNSEVFRYHILDGNNGPLAPCIEEPEYRLDQFPYVGPILEDAVSLIYADCGSNATAGAIDIDRVRCVIAVDPDDIEQDILLLVVQLYQLEQDLLNEVYLSKEWLQIKYQITEIERCIQQMKMRLIELRGQKNEIDALKAFFASDIFVYKTLVYSMMVHNESYDSARLYLNSLMPVGEEQLDYLLVQNINLDRLTDREYNLNSVDSVQLYSIGKKPYPLTGYARALYFVLTGEKLVLDLNEEEKSVPALTQVPVNNTTELQVLTYPNPTNGNFVLEASRAFEKEMTISVMDIQGRVVMTSFLRLGDTKATIDMTNLTGGLYVVTLTDNIKNNMIFQTRVIKQ
jgi:Secretion system C-terminal sorting domain/Subtilase family/Periplasmic copper-binding protein (NosD)